MNTVMEHKIPLIPLSRACDALGLTRSTVYYRQSKSTPNEKQRDENRSRKNVVQKRALSNAEREAILQVLNSSEFEDQPPKEVYHTLLERSEYVCSESTMHRILRENKANGERRNQRTAKTHAKPRLRAIEPNDVWTWDCSKLRTIKPTVYLTLYVVLDLFSRYAVAWMVSAKENSALAQQLMDQATHRYGIMPGQLTIHQDRGSPMVAHRFIDMLGELGVTLSHSRPRVSNDNPVSEAQFRTMKYQPDYPTRFDNVAHATKWCNEYFDWYNFSHHHSGLNGYTPEQVFTGRFSEIAKLKQDALDLSYLAHPERFVNARPMVKMPPAQMLINPLTPEEEAAGVSTEVNFPTLNRVKDKITLTLN
jgi:putative transposase